jgi:hypothetical protein
MRLGVTDRRRKVALRVVRAAPQEFEQASESFSWIGNGHGKSSLWMKKRAGVFYAFVSLLTRNVNFSWRGPDTV